jgi:hypothetical protein
MCKRVSSCLFPPNVIRILFFPPLLLCVILPPPPRVDECKYLGVTIDSHLSLSFHVRNVSRSRTFISPISHYHPWRPNFLSLLLAGLEFSSTQCYFCPLSFHFPFPSQEAFVRSELPKVKFNYIYLRYSFSFSFKCHLI